MAATLTSVLLHVTFSTKLREQAIPVDLLPELFSYGGGICRDMKSPLLYAGGVADHVHLLISLGKTVALSDLMQGLKRGTSSWMKNQRQGLQTFCWQDGYFAFSIGHDSIDAVKAYFDGQASHHQRVDFKDEVLGFLTKYKVAYDPQYLWD
jgi:putative transposase